MRVHPTFSSDQRGEIIDFFRGQQYAVVGAALSTAEVAALNQFVDRSKGQCPALWGVGSADIHTHGQILVDHPEMDSFARHPLTLGLVAEILGPQPRFAQIDFRDVPAGVGDRAALPFHRDRGFVPAAYWEEKQEECVYVCAIYYLSDVGEGDTCFCVVPNSHPYATREEAEQQMGPAYAEIPIRGPAGTMVLYNIAIYHTRVLGRSDAGRRTMHHYFSREGNPPLTNWALVPRRLAEHEDPETQAYYSQWTEAMRAYADAGFTRADSGKNT